MAEFAGHVVVAAILGFLGLFFEDLGVRGFALLAPVLLPAALVGLAVGRFDFGLHAQSARWVWVPAVLGLGLAWAVGGIDDGYWNIFTGGYCGDFRCLPNLLITAPVMATISYSAGAAAGHRLRRTSLQIESGAIRRA